MKKPDFFIVGAPKCGTTAMNEYLKEHPEIFVPHRKEPHFFGGDLHGPAFIRDKEEYLSLFSDATNEHRVGEASVWYLYSNRAAQEIKRFNPHSRIIAMLRDPVEMMYSLHSHWFYSGNEDIASFAEALEAEEERKQGLRISERTTFAEGLFYRDAASYAKQLQRYYETFEKENIHVVIYDDLKHDTPGVYEKVLGFLGVDTDFRPEFRTINANKMVRNTTLHEFANRPPQAARNLVRSFAPLTVRRGLGRILKRYNTKPGTRATMDISLERRLRDEFTEEIERLGALLNRDLIAWTRMER
ncbi:MAG: sulfotransferase domain-containing protein [Rubrobacteraceae bacterium]